MVSVSDHVVFVTGAGAGIGLRQPAGSPKARALLLPITRGIDWRKRSRDTKIGCGQFH